MLILRDPSQGLSSLRLSVCCRLFLFSFPILARGFWVPGKSDDGVDVGDGVGCGYSICSFLLAVSTTGEGAEDKVNLLRTWWELA